MTTQSAMLRLQIDQDKIRHNHKELSEYIDAYFANHTNIHVHTTYDIKED